MVKVSYKREIVIGKLPCKSYEMKKVMVKLPCKNSMVLSNHNLKKKKHW